jgi:DHA1 family multidrug resistance protein-like MFS transporter
MSRRTSPSEPSRDRRVRRVVIALSISAFAEWGGASAVLPLLPVFLRHQGSSVTLVGLTMAAFFIAALVVQYPLGRLSDRIGRRRIQVAGLAVFTGASLLFAFAATPGLALLFRALQGAGAGSVDVANAATIGEVVPASHRGRAFGTFYGARTVAMAIGPFFGGIIGISGMRWLFVASAACSAVAIAPILLLIPKPILRPAAPPAERSVLWRNRSMLGVTVAFVAGGLIIGVYEVCWSLLLAFRGATSWQIGLSWTLFALPFGIVSFPAGWLVDHFDRRYLIVAAMVGAACFAALYPFVHSVAWLLGLGAAEAVLVAIGMPAEAAQLAHSVPSHDLGRAQGAAATAQTAATGAAALVSGTLFGIHPWLPFAGASAIIIVCAASVARFWRGVPGRDRPPTEAAESADVAQVVPAGGPPAL